MLLRGTTVTFEVTGRARGLFRPEASDLRADVIGRLHAFFAVENVSITIAEIWRSVELFELWDYDYRATVSVTTRVDHAMVQDVGSVVANAFYEVAGTLPTVTAPAFGQAAQQPGVVGEGGTLFDPVRDALDLAREAGEGVRDEFRFTALLVVGGIVLLGFFIFSHGKRLPNISLV